MRNDLGDGLMGSGDGDSKFGFSDRTHVDTGAAGTPATLAFDEVGVPAEADKTSAMSLADLRAAGLDLDDPADASGGAPAYADAMEEPAEKTMAMSAADLAGLDDSGPAKSAPMPEFEEAAEKTAAMNIEDLRAMGAFDGLDDDDEPGAEATMMLQAGQGPLAGLEGPAPAAEPPPVPKLIVSDGNDRGITYPLNTADVLVGRGLDCDFVLNDASVSRKHFRVVRDSLTEFRMVDLGSGNGTKIDGTRIPEVLLTDGMRIELGTTTLLWRQEKAAAGVSAVPELDPNWDDGGAERTRIGEMAAMELLPDWDHANAAGGQDAEAGEAGLPAKKKGKAGLWLMVAGVVLVMGSGGLVAADKFMKLGMIFPAEAVADATDKDGDKADADKAEKTPEVDPEALEYVEDGLDAFKGQRWDSARRNFKKALKIDENVPGGAEGLKATEAELKAWEALSAADKSLEEREFATALATAKGIPDTSAYFPDAQERLRAARDGVVDAALAKARGLEIAERLPEALAEVELALKASPQDAEAVFVAEVLKAAIAEAAPEGPDTAADGATDGATDGPDQVSGTNGATDAGNPAAAAKKDNNPKVAAAGGQAHKSTKSTTKRPTTTRKPSTAKRPSTRKSAVDFAAGKQKYGAKDFGGAIDFFDGVSVQRGISKRDKAKAKSLANSVMSFSTTYGDGMGAAKAFKAQTAIKLLLKAKKLDKTISGAFQKRINQELSRQYAYLANTSYQGQRYGKAGNYARKSLALDSGQAAAQKIYDEVQAKAQSWLSGAKSAAKSNPDKAMQLLRQVIEVFPSKDARYREAYALLNELAAEADE